MTVPAHQTIRHLIKRTLGLATAYRRVEANDRTHACWLAFAVIVSGLTTVGVAQPLPARTISGPSASAEQMTEKAKAFLATLSAEQRSQAVFRIDSKDRGWWSNLPSFLVPRLGLMLGELNYDQLIAFHKLLRASTSSQGYLKMAGIMHMEELLGETLSRRGKDPDLRGIEWGVPWLGMQRDTPSLPAEIQSGDDWLV